MSAFLGPVHHWMYKKIQFQEELTDKLLTLSNDTRFKAQIESRFGVVENLPLEEMIDPHNIHGWLSERLQRAEARFAEAVIGLRKNENIEVDKLTEVARDMGREHAIPADTDVINAYQLMDDMLLDGMPCDGGRQIINEGVDELTFQYDVGVHVLCQKDQSGEGLFAAIREAMLEGMLESTSLTLLPLGESIYQLKKED